MTWYAVRTAPGAQLPQREYTTEATAIGKNGKPRGKGYRLVPSLNPNISAIERSLAQAGFTCFMPVIKRMHRDRRKLGVWKARRFPLLQGYVFVEDVHDWPSLCETPGVAGIVGTRGTPLPISQRDIDKLAAAEADAEELYQLAIKRREEAEAARNRKLTRRGLAKTLKPGALIDVVKGHAAGRQAWVVGPDRGGRIKAMLDGVGIISLPPDNIAMVEAA